MCTPSTNFRWSQTTMSSKLLQRGLESGQLRQPQPHNFLLTMLCFITTLTSAATEVTLEVIDIPTTTITLPKTRVNLLQIGGQTTNSRRGATSTLESVLDNSMYAAYCSSFVAALSNPLLTLLLGMLLLRLGSSTPA